MFGSRNDLEGFPSKYGEGLGSFLKPATLETRHVAACLAWLIFLLAPLIFSSWSSQQPARPLQDIHHVISSIPALGINSAAHSG